MKSITDKISTAALLEMLAEESTELAHAALKMARISRGENPTPMAEEQARKWLEEELADVRLCAKVLEHAIGTLNIGPIMDAKLERWKVRLMAPDLARSEKPRNDL